MIPVRPTNRDLLAGCFPLLPYPATIKHNVNDKGPEADRLEKPLMILVIHDSVMSTFNCRWKYLSLYLSPAVLFDAI